MKANQSFCCGFCFEGSSRDELSTISYLTMKGCVVLACDFQTGYFRRRVFGEERHSCDSEVKKTVKIIVKPFRFLEKKIAWLWFLLENRAVD